MPTPSLPLAGLAALGDDFATCLARVHATVDARLTAVWAARVTSLQRYGADVEVLATAARDLTLRGGDGFHAALVAAAYAGVAPEASLEPAYAGGVALELIRTYLLIQDDSIGGDQVRRGGPTVHAFLTDKLGPKNGPAGAILASDLTWGMAVDAIAAAGVPAPGILATLRLVLSAHQASVVGRQIDLLGRANGTQRSQGAAGTEAMRDLETASCTVRGALALGATLAGAPQATLDALTRFAAPAGLGLRLRDDLRGTSGANVAVVERLRGLCDDAAALAEALPLAPAARRVLAGAATALRFERVGREGESTS